MYDSKGKEAMFRSKVRSTKYFFNLEKGNYEKKVITQLKIKEGEIVSDIKRINEEIESFYKTFLTSNITPEGHTIDKEFDLFSAKLHNPKLSHEEQKELEYDLTKDELLNALKGFKPDKTPGDDGFTK